MRLNNRPKLSGFQLITAGKDHQMFKVFKPLRVQSYIEVRIGSGGW